MKLIFKIMIAVLLILNSLNANKNQQGVKMEKIKLEKFVQNYIGTWSTTNSQERKKLIDIIYSSNAYFYANEPGDPAIIRIGLKNINNHITQVTEKLIIGAKLKTTYTSYAKNHDTIVVNWIMKNNNEDIFIKGMSFLIIDKNEKISKDYIFIKYNKFLTT